MIIPTFSRFCFCLNLQTGNTICAWIFLLAYIAICLIALFSLVFGIDVIHVDQFRITETMQNATLVQDEMQEVKETRIGVADSIGTIIISAFLAVVCFLFIHGMRLHDTGKMMPYIIQNGVFGVLFIGAAIYFISLIFLVKSIVFTYISIASYSLYQVFAFEDAQKQENVQMNANFNDYGHNYEAESYGGGNGVQGGGYEGNGDEYQGP
ncbi:uncharacterized protein [Chironomus tepperi]|uniref:uncharacterized protein n=1 Tax=Chironomus tepperi TaxID=113505 RepID=UPI00391F37AE